MKYKWHKGNIGRFWPEDYKALPYIRQPITEKEVEEWRSKGYDYVKSFTGTMYDSKNPMPEWVQRFTTGILPYDNLTFTFYKMETLEIMPEHVDHFETYTRVMRVEKQNVVRILVMLEDWQPGHYLEIGGYGITDWVAGDYFVWENDVPHAAANIGVKPRYTLQITATKHAEQDIWTACHWFNIYNLPTKLHSLNSPYLTYLRNFFKNTKKPYIIYMYNQRLQELDHLVHDEKAVHFLNTVGLKIYLYEPICSYLDGLTHATGLHNMQFYSEFNGDEDPNKLRAEEFDSIKDYVIKHNLTNVTVHTCDYDVEKHYPYYKDYFKVVCDDIFVQTCRPVKPQNDNFTPNFTKKFISANWRYAIHRHMIVSYLAKLESHISWYYKADTFVLAYSHWHNTADWIHHPKNAKHFDRIMAGMDHLNRHTPCNLDLKLDDVVLVKKERFQYPMPNRSIFTNISTTINAGNNALEKFFHDAFVDITTESRFAQPTANYSEKVYFPMWFRKPFVMVGPPHTLKYLKEQGFKTFSDFWDESYDEEEIHEQRILKIFDVIDFINEKSIEELREIYNSMQDILDHNRKLVEQKIFRERT